MHRFNCIDPPDTRVGEDGAVRGPRVFTSLHGYQRAWASADLVAGITLLVIAVPEQLATSRLAGMPPITGFYAFIAGTVLFALLGSNPQMSVGADSTIAPLFAAGVATLAVTGSPHYVDLVGILAVMVGLHRHAGQPPSARLDRRVPLDADRHGLPLRRGRDHHRPPVARLPRAARLLGHQPAPHRAGADALGRRQRLDRRPSASACCS